MTAVAHEAEHHHPSPEEREAHDHKSHDATYIRTALILSVITAAETATYFAKDFPLWHWGEGLGITAFLIACMCIKFFFILYTFMHLRYDSKLLTYCFVAGLVLAIAVYFAIMAAFRVFWSGSHMVR